MSVQNVFIALRKMFVEETVSFFTTNIFAVIPIMMISKNKYVYSYFTNFEHQNIIFK